MTKPPKFQSPSGMHDVLPEDQKYFQKIYDVVSGIADFYGFGKIDTPVLEDAEIFSKGIGVSTDIIKKELYVLKTKGGDLLALRPEWTAPVVRAYIENGMQNLPQPIKLWYFGPCFRYEHPQAGRYRQFWQFGFEVLGEGGAVIDAEIIQIFHSILQELKLKNMIVEINSIGDNQCRPYYKKLLANYFKSRGVSLCVDCKRRLQENVLRILDCKQEKCQPLKADAPQVLDHLCEECQAHFKEVLEFLDETGVAYRLNPYLVRGLDYYTKTVFEIFSGNPPIEGEETGGQIAVAGGGRYDKLVKLLGGRDVPGCGAAAGIERIVGLMKASDAKIGKEAECHVFFAQIGNLGKKKGLKLLEEFRKAKVRVAESFGRDSLKAQLARADKLGAQYTLILGQKEALEGTIIVRDMQTGKQDVAKIDKVVDVVKKKIR